MPLEQLLIFISLTTLVSASPGPLMLACMAYGSRYGLGRTGQVMLGATLGNLLLMLLSALGLGLLLVRSPMLFDGLRWLGAAYLVWLGIGLWRAADEVDERSGVTAVSRQALFFKGVGIAVSNPKGILYFAALFPQFIAPERALVPQFALLSAIFVAMDLLWMLIYAKAGSLIMAWLREPRHRQWFNRGTGALMVLVGVLLGLSGGR